MRYRGDLQRIFREANNTLDFFEKKIRVIASTDPDLEEPTSEKETLIIIRITKETR